MTYIAYHLIRNIQHAYLRAALSQEVGYYDIGVCGSIATQAASNGLLIQSGISEKLGLFVQSVSTFLASFVIAFVSQWKLTLILICIIPAIVLIVGGVSMFDAKINTRAFRTYAAAASYADNLLAGMRTVHAFSLQSRTLARFDDFLRDALRLGNKRSKFVGMIFGGQYFVIYAGMGLAFWQGFGMIARGEADLGTVFTLVCPDPPPSAGHRLLINVSYFFQRSLLHYHRGVDNYDDGAQLGHLWARCNCRRRVVHAYRQTV
jgi:ATP-binding cassette, subfamily B (MDR/TAP), member 1